MANIQKHRIRKQAAIEAMGSKCQICGYNKYIGALQFHHINPESKDFHFDNIGCKSWDLIVLELKKCILLCSNCHKEVHFGVSKLPKNYIKYNDKLIKANYIAFEKPSRIKFEDRNWFEIQNYYNETQCNAKTLCSKFAISIHGVYRAVKLGLFTFRSTHKEFSKEKLSLAISQSKSMRQLCILLNVSRKMSNKIKRYIIEYNLDISHFIRKSKLQ